MQLVNMKKWKQLQSRLIFLAKKMAAAFTLAIPHRHWTEQLLLLVL